MAADVIVMMLERLPLLRGLNPSQLGEIARRAEHVVYNPGAMIIEENSEGDAAILIVSGEAVRVSGPDLKSRLEPIPAGALLGESAMLVEAIHGSTVVARGQVHALRILRDELRAQMASDPAVAEHLVVNIAHRLWRLADELREVDAVLAGKGRHLPVPPRTKTRADLPAPVH
jgi:CRP-like cAMP-binding protein